MNHGERTTAQEIDAHAAAWLARIDAGPLGAQEGRALEAWLAHDPRHRGAFVRLEAVAHLLESEHAAAPKTLPVTLLAPAPPVIEWAPERTLRPSRRHVLAGAGAAAGAVAAVAIAGVWLRRVHQIETALGEVRRLPLTDGTLAAINTQTKLSIDMRADAREVKIERGEAWFEVAKDPHRPFTVAAGEVRVRAIGTAFSVQRLAVGADVQVTEGVVEVWSVGNEANRKRVGAGTRTLASDATGPSTPIEATTEIDRALAWREGNVALDGRSLEDAAAEFNRYNALKLEVAPELRDEQIVGRFRINEPEAFARAAATMLGARMTSRANGIYLSPA